MHTERLCKLKTTKLILTILSLLTMAVAVLHFAFAGLNGKHLDSYEDLKDAF